MWVSGKWNPKSGGVGGKSGQYLLMGTVLDNKKEKNKVLFGGVGN